MFSLITFMQSIMSFDDYFMYTCVRRFENDQLSSFCMNHKGKEYTIIFKLYYDNNPNDFIIYEGNSIIYANLNRLNIRK